MAKKKKRAGAGLKPTTTKAQTPKSLNGHGASNASSKKTSDEENDVSILFKESTELYRLGRTADAASRCVTILTKHPDHFDALYLLGLIETQNANYSAAASLFGAALRTNPNSSIAHYNLALVQGRLNRSVEALASYASAVALNPDFPAAFHNRGIEFSKLNRNLEALASYDQALTIKPDLVDALYSRGNVLMKLGRHEEAIESYQRAFRLRPDHAGAANNCGLALESLKRFEAAISYYDNALAIKPDHVEALNNRGNALSSLRRYQEAVACYNQALALRQDYAEALSNRANALMALGNHDLALEGFRRALAIKPNYADAHNNYGIALAALNKHEEAISAFDSALANRPAWPEALNNRALSLAKLGQHTEAIASYQSALEYKPDYAEALYNRGNALVACGRHADALTSFRNALSVQPELPHALGALTSCALQICDWTTAEQSSAKLLAQVVGNKSILSPFVLLGLSCEPKTLLQCAANYVRSEIPITRRPLRGSSRRPNGKIKLAYLSADFRRHPVGDLIASLIEQHDRTTFEVLGLSYGPDDGSETRKRVFEAFDSAYDVQRQGNLEAAKLLAEQNVDIAIDLGGHTAHARLGILAHRPAPIQVSYLGYAGTTGADFIDYLFADPIVVPERHLPFYSEKIVFLPDTYMVTDSSRASSSVVSLRSEHGLPERAFVFCCFNSSYKISSAIFDVWMRILSAVDGSVLWLSQTNERATVNLRQEAKSRGVDPSRIIFAPKLPRIEDHLARHRLADLFLDTLPYGAHATALDALWAGLPMVSCLGDTFAGRVGASLLSAAGLSDLVAENLDQYQAIAIRLAANPEELIEMRTQLINNRSVRPLYDTNRFRRHIEQAFSAIWEMHLRQETPRSFYI